MKTKDKESKKKDVVLTNKKNFKNDLTCQSQPVSRPLNSNVKRKKIGTIGVCAMDTKVLSKPCRKILNRLIENEEFDTVIFGEKIILDEVIENWPTCDFLISFFSTGFPLDKAIEYLNYRKPYVINDLVLQKSLWDRRLVLKILKHLNITIPTKVEISRDGGPHLDPMLKDRLKNIGLSNQEIYDLSNQKEPEWEMIDDDTLKVGDSILKKPFVEKPVDGEDHNIFIYYPKSTCGGGRKLFRKVGNKSSEYDPYLVFPRTEGSFIYEKFLESDNFEDVKAYTVGSNYCHAETRKSPVVDGIVKRDTHGKEIRFTTSLSNSEKQMAKNISFVFKQTICGFDLLRIKSTSYVIDVNGFSFVKDNNEYYDSCARILRSLFIKAKRAQDVLKKKISCSLIPLNQSQFEKKELKWVFKGMVLVIRHADRTPKQKLKFSFTSNCFIDLVNGHKEEVIINNVENLKLVLNVVKFSQENKTENSIKLNQLRTVLEKKMFFSGTKIQIKPVYDLKLSDKINKVKLILKWGGESTHSAKYQAYEFGELLRQNLKLLNHNLLKAINVYTSSERRVIASAQFSTLALLGLKNNEKLPDNFLIIKKNLLDDTNAAKTQMDKVKKKLKKLLREGVDASPHFSWPQKMPQPFIVLKRICELVTFCKEIMNFNFRTKNVNKFQNNWCCEEDPTLLKERWDKLFDEFSNVDKINPSMISELYDTLKFDSIHNKQFLLKVFSYNHNDNELIKILAEKCSDTFKSPGFMSDYSIDKFEVNNFGSNEKVNKVSSPNMDSSFDNSNTNLANVGWCSNILFLSLLENLHSNSINNYNTNNLLNSESTLDNSFNNFFFSRLRELYKLSKILFGFICPQEYGIKNDEKLEIGLLTSFPLVKQLLFDIQSMTKNGSASVINYFTKESHIYTLLNVLYESHIPIKIARNTLPELDYLSQIAFEVYEADDTNDLTGKKHSIRLTLSPGCHTQDPLDIQLDDDHHIGCIPKFNLTRHLDVEFFTQKLKYSFSKFSLPKT